MEHHTLFKKSFNYFKLVSSDYCRKFIFFLKFGIINNKKATIIEEDNAVQNMDGINLIAIVSSALEYSNTLGRFPAPRNLRFIEGMSGQRFRSFLFYLSKNLSTFNYLEIGVWKGSTASCILKNGKAKAILVDNWSQFGGPRKAANKRLRKYIKESNALLVDSSLEMLREEYIFESPLVYFYDGAHDYQSHLEATLLINQFKSSQLIYIVDDWNWENVRNGTIDGLKQVKLKIVKQWQIFPNIADKGGKYGAWHNGTFICILSRDLY